MSPSPDAAVRTGWQPVPLVTAESRAAGHFGGEGAQWPQALAIDSTGEFLLFGTDVGGIFRSTNGGDLWEPCNVGYSPRGNSGFAIDPRNPARCLAVGTNSVAHPLNGLYLTTDRAASWEHVLPAQIRGYRDFRRQIVFDASSYDPEKGYCTRAYWSRLDENPDGNGNPEVRPVLYVSEDGGRTWNEITGSARVGDSHLAVDSETGWLFAANEEGLLRSRDYGQTFEVVFEEPVLSLCALPSLPGHLYWTTEDGVHRSDDLGESFDKLAGENLAASGPLLNLTVSPADPDRMTLWRNIEQWNWPRYTTHDGGKSWMESTIDETNAFLPVNARQGLFAWHPAEPDVVFSNGGDLITKSSDGGKTFHFAGDGCNGVLVGGMWNFCTQDPDVLYFGSQDYNGAITTDRGWTWRYVNASGQGWGGFCYGGYAASEDVLIVGVSQGWHQPRLLHVSRDGGITWRDTGLQFGGPDASYGDPADPSVIFASNYRSTDGGETWEAMEDCSAVLTHDTSDPSRLFGVHRSGERWAIVRSGDKGITWQEVAVAPQRIRDLAWDPTRQRIYAVCSEDLWYLEEGRWTMVENVPLDQLGRWRFSTVAVDPVDPDVVYAGGKRDLFKSSVAVIRSLDGGLTWENLTRTEPLDGMKRDGGREAICARVHPTTRELYVSTGCYGIWKHSPPGPYLVSSLWATR